MKEKKYNGLPFSSPKRHTCVKGIGHDGDILKELNEVSMKYGDKAIFLCKEFTEKNGEPVFRRLENSEMRENVLYSKNPQDIYLLVMKGKKYCYRKMKTFGIPLWMKYPVNYSGGAYEIIED
jgi:hypothetical protein